jgi:hypothetical protein
MTDIQRHKAILSLIESYTTTHAISQSSAKAALYREGLFTKKGEPRRRYDSYSLKVNAQV